MALQTSPVMNICHDDDEQTVSNRMTTMTVRDTENALATIFVVEDDPAMAGTLSKALRASGYRVLVATTGSEALALFRNVQPDLILLDLMLPDTDGLVLTTSLRTLTSAPIVICSGRQGQIDRVMGARLGAADFVGKPFELDDLEACIERSLRRARQQDDEPSLSDEIRGWRLGHRADARARVQSASEQSGMASQWREAGNDMGRT
jgi:DNA-binding response OmpR family regulator